MLTTYYITHFYINLHFIFIVINLFKNLFLHSLFPLNSTSSLNLHVSRAITDNDNVSPIILEIINRIHCYFEVWFSSHKFKNKHVWLLYLGNRILNCKTINMLAACLNKTSRFRNYDNHHSRNRNWIKIFIELIFNSKSWCLYNFLNIPYVKAFFL